jgi:hypothetical protein
MPYRTLARRSIGTTYPIRVDVHLDGEEVTKEMVVNWISSVLRGYKDFECSLAVAPLDEENVEFNPELLSELLGIPLVKVRSIMDCVDRDKWMGLAEAYFGNVNTKHRQLMYMFGVLLRGSQ